MNIFIHILPISKVVYMSNSIERAAKNQHLICNWVKPLHGFVKVSIGVINNTQVYCMLSVAHIVLYELILLCRNCTEKAWLPSHCGCWSGVKNLLKGGSSDTRKPLGRWASPQWLEHMQLLPWWWWCSAPLPCPAISRVCCPKHKNIDIVLVNGVRKCGLAVFFYYSENLSYGIEWIMYYCAVAWFATL